MEYFLIKMLMSENEVLHIFTSHEVNFLSFFFIHGFLLPLEPDKKMVASSFFIPVFDGFLRPENRIPASRLLPEFFCLFFCVAFV